MKKICKHDYPDKLPNLFTQVMAFLEQRNQYSVLAGLQGLLAIVEHYEFHAADDRDAQLEKIVEACFPVLGELVGQMMSNKSNDDALYLLYLVC